MRKVGLLIVLVTLLAGMSMALDLSGKTGVGLRADTLSVRRFVNNNFAVDVSAFYSTGTKTGQADSYQYDYALGGFYAKEIFTNTLLEIGATLQGWQGKDAGQYFNGLGINPFIGGECFINNHVSLDGKVFIGAYSHETMNGGRTTSLDVLTGNLGAHIYL
jgi:hypothetical protein